MVKQEFSIPKLAQMVASEADAYLLLEDLRWGGKPSACPHCGGMDRCYYLTPANGTSRKTRTGAASERRVSKCGHLPQAVLGPDRDNLPREQGPRPDVAAGHL